MRMYSGIVQAVKETEREVWELGHKTHSKSFQDKRRDEGYDSRELIGYSLSVSQGTDWRDSFTALGFEIEEAKRCIEYVVQESSDRWARRNNLNPGYSYMKRPEVWEKFLEPNRGQFSYTYPERMFSPRNQVDRIGHLVELDPGSRQLIIQIYNQEYDDFARGGIRRIPCTMYYQLLIRQDSLTFIHNMRSCDLYTHFAIDLSISWLLAFKFSEVYNLHHPRVVMNIGSLHAWEEDLHKRGIF